MPLVVRGETNKNSFVESFIIYLSLEMVHGCWSQFFILPIFISIAYIQSKEGT